MSTLDERFAKLRLLYPDPDDIQQIAAEEERVHALLKRQEYAALDETKVLVALCRDGILRARKRLATDKALIGDEITQRALWAEIDARQWFLNMVVKDYPGELAQIEAQLEADLQT